MSTRKKAPKKEVKPQKPEIKSSKTAGRLDDVIEKIKEFSEAHGYPPSIRDLSEAIKVSHSAVVVWLRELQKQGRITREPRIPRSIKLVA
jgi:repressor LexA